MNIHSTDIAIIGAGPSGLFSVFEAGMMGYSCTVIDSLDETGGQLSALYPEKPIYDIPGFPSILAKDLIKNLETQIAPFNPNFLLGNPIETLEKEEETWILSTKSDRIQAKAVIIAAGGGMFAPRKPPVEHLENFEDASVFYAVKDKTKHAGKTLVIAGGGDSAVDWAVDLAESAKHIHMVHRRKDFRAKEGTVQKMMSYVDAGKITLHTPSQLSALHGENGVLQKVTLADLDQNKTEVDADHLLCFFGIAPSLGPVAKWGLESNGKKLVVNPETMETNVPGLLAVGDIAYYPSKISLILVGFAETAVALKTIQKHIDPDKLYKTIYSTSKGVPTLEK